MAHPYHEHRQHKVERSRVHKLYRASGGRCGPMEDSSVDSDGEIAKKELSRGARGHLKGGSPSVRKKGGHVAGAKTKHRMDRKRGGAVKHRQGGGKLPFPPPKDDMTAQTKQSAGKDTMTADTSSNQPDFLKGATPKKHGGHVKRARGGRTKHKGKTVVNVMVGQHPGGAGGMPALPPPPMMPPRVPGGPPPGMPPGMPPGGPPGLAGGLPPGLAPGPPPPGGPPPIPPRATGGAVSRVSKPMKTVTPLQGRGATSRAVGPAKARGLSVPDRARPLSGGASTPGDVMPADSSSWKEGERHATPVQHTDGKTNQQDIGRPKPITYHKGGAVKGVSKATAPVKPIQGQSRVSQATPPAYSAGAVSRALKPAKALGSHQLKSGSGGGLARLEKAKRASPSGVL
jgi:hypothetical protein